MHPINNYDFHDAEIKFVSFDGMDIHLNILNTRKTEYVKLTFTNTIGFTVKTNSAQMVIESINMSYKDEFINNILFDKFLNDLDIELERVPEENICVQIVPIVGGDIVVLCGGFIFSD